jgi:hypothetical protein
MAIVRRDARPRPPENSTRMFENGLVGLCERNARAGDIIFLTSRRNPTYVWIELGDMASASVVLAGSER